MKSGSNNATPLRTKQNLFSPEFLSILTIVENPREHCMYSVSLESSTLRVGGVISDFKRCKKENPPHPSIQTTTRLPLAPCLTCIHPQKGRTRPDMFCHPLGGGMIFFPDPLPLPLPPNAPSPALTWTRCWTRLSRSSATSAPGSLRILLASILGSS